MKKRIFFNKTKDMIYISHLDTIRYFERLFKMTGIKMKFSEGFNPRPKISFGQAISLGIEAYNEPIDIELIEDIENTKLLQLLQSKSAKGFDIKEVIDIEQSNSISKDYIYVKYELKFENKSTLEKFETLLNKDEIIVSKEKNGKITQRDLKVKINCFEVEGDKILMKLEDISPNAIVNTLSEEEQESITITRLAYIEK